MHIYCKRRIKFLLILPTFILLCVYTLYPLVETVWQSFYEKKAFTPYVFVGFDNYINWFNNELFYKTLGNTLIIWVVSLALLIPLGLLLGFLLNMKLRGITIVKVATFMPVILSGIMIGIVWSFIVDPGIGVLNGFFYSVGLDDWALQWIGGRTITPYTVAVIESWKSVGFYGLLFMAGLKMIPKDCLEAAEIDGASSFQRAWYVTLPLLKEQTKIVVVMISISALKSFEMVRILTSGGPMRQSHTVSTLLYEVFFKIEMDFGYGSALAIFQFILIMSTTILFLHLTQKRVED